MPHRKPPAAPSVALGTNPERARRHNRRVVLETLRQHGRLGRSDIANLTRLTAQAVGKSITVWLDGAVLTEPVVREPIAGGRLSISGMDDAQIERARAAVAAPCPFGAGDPASTAA